MGGAHISYRSGRETLALFRGDGSRRRRGCDVDIPWSYAAKVKRSGARTAEIGSRPQAEDAAYPVGGRFAHRVTGSGGSRLQLLVVRATLGTQQVFGTRITEETRNLRHPGERTAEPVQILFNSVRGGPHRPHLSGPGEQSVNASLVHVVYESNQLYPAFVVEVAVDGDVAGAVGVSDPLPESRSSPPPAKRAKRARKIKKPTVTMLTLLTVKVIDEDMSMDIYCKVPGTMRLPTFLTDYFTRARGEPVDLANVSFCAGGADLKPVFRFNVSFAAGGADLKPVLLSQHLTLDQLKTEDTLSIRVRTRPRNVTLAPAPAASAAPAAPAPAPLSPGAPALAAPAPAAPLSPGSSTRPKSKEIIKLLEDVSLMLDDTTRRRLWLFCNEQKRKRAAGEIASLSMALIVQGPATLQCGSVDAVRSAA